MLYLAIDQHRKQLTVNLRNEAGDVILKRQVSTEWKRVREFLEDIRERSEPEGGFVAILEVCGFNDWLLKLLEEYGCRETILVQPEKRSKKKTDRRDANALGRDPVGQPRAAAGGQEGPGGPSRAVCPASRTPKTGRSPGCGSVWGDSARGRSTRSSTSCANTTWSRSVPPKGSTRSRGRSGWPKCPSARSTGWRWTNSWSQWKLWDEQIEKVEAEIAKRQAKSKTAAILATIPGCGAYGSLALASRIGPIERFPRPGSLANYWGLTPRCRNSGEATDRLGSITKQGSAMARFILGQLVLHVLRRDPWMKAWYGRIKRRRGSKIARVAVMRRLADISRTDGQDTRNLT